MSSEATSYTDAEVQSEPFRYAPTANESLNVNGDGLLFGTPGTPQASSPLPASNKQEQDKREKDAFERGLRDGENRAKTATEARLKAVQDAIQKAVAAFQIEREEYFNRVEPEVVQLALAIARKILHRESQIDPLLLTGLVHVALEKLDAGTCVRLRIPPADTHFWNEFFAASSKAVVPELVGDPSVPNGEIALESEVGSTQISLETQLKEIEQGFFDLLEQRPRVR
jgi:flagellar assembly protein FliH